MAVRFDQIKQQMQIVLYDYMLTSDAESFWFSLTAIREGLSADIPGAFAKRAIDALISEKLVEDGHDGSPANEIFALSDKGIREAEKILMAKGWDLADYQPAPDIDRIISRAHEPEIHAQIAESIASLRAEVRTSNELGAALENARDLVSDELEAATTLSSKDRFRLRALNGLLLPALRYLADKFVGGGVGEAAKQLADLMMKLI